MTLVVFGPARSASAHRVLPSGRTYCGRYAWWKGRVLPRLGAYRMCRRCER